MEGHKLMKPGSLVKKSLLCMALLGVLSWSFPTENANALSMVQDPTPVTKPDGEAKQEAKQDPIPVDDVRLSR